MWYLLVGLCISLHSLDQDDNTQCVRAGGAMNWWSRVIILGGPVTSRPLLWVRRCHMGRDLSRAEAVTWTGPMRCVGRSVVKIIYAVDRHFKHCNMECSSHDAAEIIAHVDSILRRRPNIAHDQPTAQKTDTSSTTGSTSGRHRHRTTWRHVTVSHSNLVFHTTRVCRARW